MNENIDLRELLKNCPKGTKFWCLAMGTVVLTEVSNSDDFPIVVKSEDKHYHYFTKKGTLCKSDDASCILFPSKDQRDWSKWKYSNPKFDPRTLKPFDKVLIKRNSVWECNLFNRIKNIYRGCYYFRIITITGGEYDTCIPYNDDTEHLIGSDGEAPDYYRYWED